MSKRLLVVDDEPNLLMAVSACLRAEGYEAQTARSGKEALIYLSSTIPDLIISDIRMPFMDGYELARRIRASSHTALVPIVFLTAKDETANRVEGFRSGVDVYLTKPFEPEELLAVVANILGRVERVRSAIAHLVGAENKDAETDNFYDEELTEAEGRIATAVARGLSNKEIATELDISYRTVENHISRILAKKGFSNRVEVALYVLAQSKND